jgi:hypothetical protein
MNGKKRIVYSANNSLKIALHWLLKDPLPKITFPLETQVKFQNGCELPDLFFLVFGLGNSASQTFYDSGTSWFWFSSQVLHELYKNTT